MSKILVTGGAGYIGGHIVHMLIESGAEVVVADDFSYGRRDHVPAGVKVYEGDLKDKTFVASIFEQEPVTAVIHLAASLEVEESVREPEKYFEQNVRATRNLLKAMRTQNVKKMTFASTAAAYGEVGLEPVKEHELREPNNPYGHSKVIAESLIDVHCRWFGLQAVSLRFFNVCGVSPKYGVVDTHKASHMLPIIIEAALGKREKFVVNGGDYPTPDGSCVRDFVHVMDIARAHIVSLDYIDKHPASKLRVFNVGTGSGHSVLQMVAAAKKITGKDFPVEIGPRRAGDAPSTIANVEYIQKEMGFVCEHSSPEEIIESTWRQMARQV
ncbi:MAG TPA: UDP-glucose 4-epimerase GalE [Patescibacteria group bacterium]|nr:UDP-glucose 4-epimerase GalE [Patescibacteria group bacterium]